MFQIQTLNNISPIGLAQFPEALYKISNDCQHPDAILVRSQNMLTLSLPESVKIIGRAGAGVNNIPVTQLTAKGIPVLNTPGANANAVRELVIAGMLLASRNLYSALNYVHQLKKNDADMSADIEKNKKQFIGNELLGKTLGVIGLGSIGVKVANAARALGMRIVGYDPAITVSRAWELSSDVQQAKNLDHLFQEADFITFHVPLVNETRNMIAQKQLHVMKKNVVLLNFSRDGIIDNEALVQALTEKKIAAYVCDFPSVKLMDFPNAYCLPHLGASTHQAEENCAVMISKQIREFLEHGIIMNSVNFPTVDMLKPEGVTRIAVVNENIPNMVAQISTVLAESKINIDSLANHSRQEIAYTLIDVSSTVNEAILKSIAAIKGVIRIRKI